MALVAIVLARAAAGLQPSSGTEVERISGMQIYLGTRADSCW